MSFTNGGASWGVNFQNPWAAKENSPTNREQGMWRVGPKKKNQYIFRKHF
jgi:hypothetical protein